MIKLILCIAIIALCGFIGYGISSHYSDRKKFFFSLTNFLNSLKTNIEFSATNLKKILMAELKQNTKSKDFCKMIENYLMSLDCGDEFIKETLFNNIKILTEEEKECIFYFFKKLGKVDSFSQIEEIDKLFKVNGIYYSDAKEESKKYGSLYIKLGIIIGAFIALMII